MSNYEQYVQSVLNYALLIICTLSCQFFLILLPGPALDWHQTEQIYNLNRGVDQGLAPVPLAEGPHEVAPPVTAELVQLVPPDVVPLEAVDVKDDHTSTPVQRGRRRSTAEHARWLAAYIRNFNAEHFNASALQDTNVSKLSLMDF